MVNQNAWYLAEMVTVGIRLIEGGGGGAGFQFRN